MQEFTSVIKSPIKVPPQDIEAERALLGSLMLKPAGIYDVADIISREAFYAERHRTIFDAITDLFSKSNPTDIVSVASRLREKSQLEKIGGASYLAELTNVVSSSSNIKHYAQIIKKKYTLRSLIEASDYIGELGYSQDHEVETLLDNAEKKILNITSFSLKQKFVNIKDTLQEAWDRFDRLHKSKGELRGVRTGFDDLDHQLAGLQNSDLVILAARPSMGKTSLALDIARQAALKHNVPVGVFSLEMSAQQLVDRVLAAESHVDAWKLRTGKLSTDDEFARIRDAMDRLSNAQIFIDDEPGNSILRMRSVARRLKAENNLGLVIIDYMQLMVPPSNRTYDSMVQQVTEISRSLKGLARELDIPVMALSQLNRNVETRGGKPKLSDLRDSGSIEQDADVVMFIHHESKNYDEEIDKSKNSVAEIIIAKHRNGPTGAVQLYFDRNRVSFMNIERGDFGSLS